MSQEAREPTTSEESQECACTEDEICIPCHAVEFANLLMDPRVMKALKREVRA